MLKYPKILTEDQTVDMALRGRSLTRFGDGELRLAAGGSCTSQRAEKGLAEELRLILAKRGRALPCLPNITVSPKAHWWRAYREDKFRYLMTLPEYGSAFVTRPDNAPHIDRPDYWDKIRGLWRDKDVVLVRGDEKSLTPARMSEARSVRDVLGPRQHAYVELRRIEEEIGTPSGPVILCLGAAATVLAWRLANRGVYALDLGHVGMFMRHAGAYATSPGQLASETHRAAMAARHGNGGWQSVAGELCSNVLAFREAIGADSMLDYGCGLGQLRAALGAQRIYEYDPGVKGRAVPPKPANLVTLIDVLENVEPDKLDNVLRHVAALASKGVFVTVNLGDERALTQQSASWWIDKLRGAGLQPRASLERGDGRLLVTVER